MSVVSNLSFNAQNTGTFQVSDTAFKSGDSSPDRDHQGNPYIPHYSEEDTFAFQHQQIAYAPPKTTLTERLYNLDIRLIYALIFSLVTFIFAQPFLENWSYLLSGIVFFGYYIMSFFNFKNVAEVVNRPRQPEAYQYYQSPEQQSYYYPASYQQQEAVGYY